MPTPDLDKASYRCEAFGRRVSQLSDADWRALNDSCAALNSTSFAALVGRARLQASPHSLPSAMRNALPVTRLINAGLRVYANLTWFAFEFGREFDADQGAERWAREPQPKGEPRVDRFISATYEIEKAIAPRIAREPGVAAALRTAQRAIMLRDILDDDEFREIYAFVEPVIPYASLSSEP